jgi:hypothetical protein
VAALDAAVVLVIAFLTWVVHSQTSVAAAEHHVKTQALEDRLRDAIWASTLELRKRASLSGAIDRFGRTAKKLIDELRAEREHLTELVNSRERRAADLRNFALDFGTAAAAMSTSANEMAAKVAGATSANATLANHVERLVDGQGDLESRLIELVTMLATTSDASRQVASAAEVAANTISEAAETVGPGNARMADSAAVLRLEVAQLREDLLRDAAARRQDVEASGQKVADAVDRVTDAVREQREAVRQLLAELASQRSPSTGPNNDESRA